MEEEDYSGWSLRDRLELLAFKARLAGVPSALVVALWEVIDCPVAFPSGDGRLLLASRWKGCGL